MVMLDLDKSHPGAEELLKRNGFSVNRSDVPSSRTTVDITIEQTIKRHAKSHGGSVGFSLNHSAYYRWCRTRHTRVSLSSGAPLPSHVENDVLMADEIGKKAHQEFVHERLVDKKTSLHSPVKKHNLKASATQAKSSVVRGKSRKDIEITAERTFLDN